MLSPTRRTVARCLVVAQLMVVAAPLLTCCSESPPDEGSEDDGGQDNLDTKAALDGGIDDTGPATDTANDSGEAACPGGPDCPCTNNDDCDAGLCMWTHEGKTCARGCVDFCPLGFVCVTLTGAGADVRVVCVSKTVALCDPCDGNDTCIHAGASGARCVPHGDSGSFCGVACDVSADCQTGFSCKDVTDTDGAKTRQCVPTDEDGALAACTCSKRAMAQSLTTSCDKALLSDGKQVTCKGKRRCAADGLTPCSASEPAPEACDGVDNDCDGVVDNGGCDDGNPCTVDDCSKDQACSHSPMPDKSPCDADGSVCTQGDSCAAGACVVGAAKNCDDKNPCTEDACVPASGCTQTNDDGAPCTDDNPCTVGDTCQGGQCSKGPAKVCSSFDACTDAKCDFTSGKCVPIGLDNGTPCEDGNACTVKDACAKGVCKGAAKVCDDNNPCTDDTCDKKSGCKHSENTGSCDDGDGCTVGDACAAGGCKAGAVKPCADGGACAVGSCNKATGDCVYDGSTKAGAACDADGSPCTESDACDGGKCVAGKTKNCDDGNGCTDDSCDKSKGCVHKASSAPCQDGNLCTVNDSCKKGVCVGGAAKTCDDGNPCTQDTCTNGTGGCAFLVKPLEGKPCDADGSLCTVADSCVAGVCKAGQPKSCDDKNPCTQDGCSAAKGTCTSTPIIGCGGNCKVDGDCKDETPCTNETCSSGKCAYPPSAAKCDDGNPCTSADTCSGGACQPGKAKDCDDNNVCTQDACDKSKGTCTHSPNSLDCTDGNACTVGDACAQGSCQAGKGKDCSDNDPCTVDSCATTTGKCTSVAKACGANETCVAGVCKADSPLLSATGSKHTEANCTQAGGQVVNGDGKTMCRFNAGTCPTGWSPFQSWSTTVNKSIVINRPKLVCKYTLPPCKGYVPKGFTLVAVNNKTISSGSHGWANKGRETKGAYNPVSCNQKRKPACDGPGSINAVQEIFSSWGTVPSPIQTPWLSVMYYSKANVGSDGNTVMLWTVLGSPIAHSAHADVSQIGCR